MRFTDHRDLVSLRIVTALYLITDADDRASGGSGNPAATTTSYAGCVATSVIPLIGVAWPRGLQ